MSDVKNIEAVVSKLMANPDVVSFTMEGVKGFAFIKTRNRDLSETREVICTHLKAASRLEKIKSDRLTVTERNELMTELYREGLSQKQIAFLFKVSQTLVSKALG